MQWLASIKIQPGATGSNPCVGFLGPALGGGHGRYQGLHGLASDNFINLNVVLADGSTVQVNKNSHSDLFWAMQGAGHNYGIVTSAESRIYPRKIDTWHYHNYVWSQDKLEILFERLNALHKDGKTPPEMGVEFGSVAVDPSFNTTDPVLSWTFGYAGPAKDAERLLKPFNDIPSPELQAPAQKLADQIRDIWFTSQPGHKPSVYANYATGVEPLGAMYGYEPWRMQRLLGLKAKYDPHNRFRFYNPLIKG
ncbi:hypothetical protein PG996_015621 [Apiospora saccharicola]|uniref:FAD-binding PCMH-type domain-containing protein n=1 Tax=Apiospora saccharicola TaxID=335842 RepID=A0ABR1TMD4_9PEZI